MSEVLLHEGRATLSELLERAAAGDRVTVVREDGAAFEFDVRPVVQESTVDEATIQRRLAALARLRELRAQDPQTDLPDAVDDVRRNRGWTEEEITAARIAEGRA
jgi:antitoxin (DNA-binding transcriptional repressor) of toxin-antitoxin stability system